MTYSRRRSRMSKYFRKIGLALLCTAALVTPAFAADNVSGLAADESAEGTVFKSLTASNNYFATRYTCTDTTATFVAAAIADCCIAGDIWRATVVKGNGAARFAN